MDLSTILGIMAAFALMISAIMMGGSIFLFINIPSIVIVLGGTIGATLVHLSLIHISEPTRPY